MKTMISKARRCGRYVLLGLTLVAANTAFAAEWAYVARPGDDLWKITQRYLRDIRYVSQLQSYNGIEDPSHVAAGTRIRIPVEWSKFTPAPAQAAQVNGEVLYRTAQDHRQRPLKAGTELGIGSEISTGDDGTMFLRFADGSELALKPNSTVKLDSMSAFGDSGMVDSRVRLLDGRIEFNVKRKPEGESHFEVNTPAATTAVRGTVFRVNMAARETTSRTEVTRGKVAVTGAGTERDLPEKFGTLVEKGKAPLPPVPLLEGPDLSGVPDKIEVAAFYLDWPGMERASGYRAQVSPSQGFETTFFDRTSSRPRIGISGLPDGDYHVRVRAIDKLELEGLDEEASFSLNARPEPPVITSPLPGQAVAGQDPLLSWTIVDNDDTYDVQIARDRAFSNIIARAENLETPSFAPEGLAEGTYFWRISRTAKSGEHGPFSPPMPFTIASTRPSDSSAGRGSERMTFAWPGVAEFRYAFQLARDPAFEVILLDRVLDKPELDMKKLIGGRYFLRIATIDETGYQAPFGATAYVDVPLL